MVLFINGCVRENSRTLDLARTVLLKENDEVQEVNLFECGIEALNKESLLLRENLTKRKEFDHSIFRWAAQFAQADTIVIAAPYWDLMFPAVVRAYLEAVTVNGVTFCYNENGIPQGLCKATRLFYVTTAGGPIIQNFGFDYIDALAKTFYGIQNTRCVYAEGLDIWGADPEAIIKKAKREY